MNGTWLKKHKKAIQFVFVPIFLTNGLSFLALFALDCVRWPALPSFAVHHALAMALTVSSLFFSILFGVLGIALLLSTHEKAAVTKTPRHWIRVMSSLLQCICYSIWAYWGIASLGKTPAPALGILSLLAFVIYSTFSTGTRFLGKPESEEGRPVPP